MKLMGVWVRFVRFSGKGRPRYLVHAQIISWCIPFARRGLDWFRPGAGRVQQHPQYLSDCVARNVVTATGSILSHDVSMIPVMVANASVAFSGVSLANVHLYIVVCLPPRGASRLTRFCPHIFRAQPVCGDTFSSSSSRSC